MHACTILLEDTGTEEWLAWFIITVYLAQNGAGQAFI